MVILYSGGQKCIVATTRVARPTKRALRVCNSGGDVVLKHRPSAERILEHRDISSPVRPRASLRRQEGQFHRRIYWVVDARGSSDLVPFFSARTSALPLLVFFGVVMPLSMYSNFRESSVNVTGPYRHRRV